MAKFEKLLTESSSKSSKNSKTNSKANSVSSEHQTKSNSKNLNSVNEGAEEKNVKISLLNHDVKEESKTKLQKKKKKEKKNEKDSLSLKEDDLETNEINERNETNGNRKNKVNTKEKNKRAFSFLNEEEEGIGKTKLEVEDGEKRKKKKLKGEVRVGEGAVLEQKEMKKGKKKVKGVGERKEGKKGKVEKQEESEEGKEKEDEEKKTGKKMEMETVKEKEEEEEEEDRDGEKEDEDEDEEEEEDEEKKKRKNKDTNIKKRNKKNDIEIEKKEKINLEDFYVEDLTALTSNKLVDDESAKYFRDISNHLNLEKFEDEEEVQILCKNVLEETQKKEIIFSCDPDISKILEQILSLSSPADVADFYSRIACQICEFSANPCACHVAEKCMQVMAKHLSFLEKDEKVAWLDVLEASLNDTCQALTSKPIEVLCNKYASHFLRTFLKLLSGKNCEKKNLSASEEFQNSKFKISSMDTIFKQSNLNNEFENKNKKQKEKEKEIENERNKIRKITFPLILNEIFGKFLEASQSQILILRIHPIASPVFQTMMDVVKEDKEAIKFFCTFFLGCPDPSKKVSGKYFKNSNVDDVADFTKDEIGSFLMKCIIQYCDDDIYDEILKRFFKNKLNEYCTHPFSNFVIQTLIMFARNEEQVKIIEKEIFPIFEKIIKHNQTGLILNLILSCSKFNSCLEHVSSELDKTVTSLKNVSKFENLCEKYLKLDYGILYGSKLSHKGSAILKALLQFPNEISVRYATCLTQMSVEEIVFAAKDSSGSRVIEIILTKHFPIHLKLALIQKFTTHFVELAIHPVGSFVLEKCFSIANLKTKEMIIEELSKEEKKIMGEKLGTFIAHRFQLSTYTHSADKWRRFMSSKEDFLKTFSNSGKSKDRFGDPNHKTLHRVKKWSKPERLSDFSKKVPELLGANLHINSKSKHIRK